MKTEQNGTKLEAWLKQATCSLAASARAQVRTEIQEHYESACEEARSHGLAPEQTDGAAVASLGDAKTANREYRDVMLSKAEARLLREGNWEARAFCSLRMRGWFFLIPGAVLGSAIAAFVSGRNDLGWLLLLAMKGLLLLLAAPLLPIYTPGRSRVFRSLKWAWMAAMLSFAFWPHILEYSWLIACCAWPLVWVEWKRFSLRRKIPVEQWPKQLYL